MSDFRPEQLATVINRAIAKRGGNLVSLDLDQIDNHPGRRITATFAAVVDWPHGRRDEVFGVSASGEKTDVWLYPEDPALPGLPRATYSGSVAEILNESGYYSKPVDASQLRLKMIVYRPLRRAILRADVIPTQETFYLKVHQDRVFESVLHRHNLLANAGLPVPQLVAATYDKIMVSKQLLGKPWNEAIFSDSKAVTGEKIVSLLDSLPADVAKLDRRPPWAYGAEHYAELTKTVAPNLSVKVDWLLQQIQEGLADIPLGNEATHGDFHESQVFVSQGQITGLLDIDTVGPGRRADDLGCLIAHLTTIQNMNKAQTAKVHQLIQSIVPVFDERVDPIELRLRAAAVILSLATGPYRSQEQGWEQRTRLIVNAGVALARQIA